VAAAVASHFFRELEHLGFAGAGRLDDLTFLVIAGTVLVYGLTLRPLSGLLGLSNRNPQGVLLVGAHRWPRTLGHLLRQEGVRVRLVDKNRNRVLRGREAGLNVKRIDVMTEKEFQRVVIISSDTPVDYETGDRLVVMESPNSPG